MKLTSQAYTNGSKAGWRPVVRRARVAALALTCASWLDLAATAQAPPSLRISAPADKTIVHPGSIVSVVVDSPSGSSVSQVVLIGEHPLDLAEASASLPLAASVLVPVDADPGGLLLTATATTLTGAMLEAEPGQIQVERPDMPTQLSVEPDTVTFESPGGPTPLIVLATFADGAVRDVTESSYLTVTSSNTDVVTVGQEGLVTAVAPGEATLVIAYRREAESRQIVVPVMVAQPLLAATPAALSFGDQNVGATVTQSVALTNNTLGPLRVLGLGSEGDYTAQSNCVEASPLAPGASCAVLVAFTPLAPGARSGMVAISTSFYSAPVGVSARGVGIGRQPTTTTLRAYASPSVFGQIVTLTAAVTGGSGPTPTGTVRFVEGATVLGEQPLASGEAVLPGLTWATGSHTPTAIYDGNATLAPSEGTIVHTVNRATTSTALATSANPVILGATVTVTVSVAVQAPGSGVPTGTVSLSNGAVSLGSAALVAGQATMSTASLPVGMHALTAGYAGDGNFTSATSPALAQRVEYQPGGVSCRGEAGHRILQPINADGTSVFNQGRTVPAKFRVCDAAGRSIGTPGVVQDFRLSQVIAGTASDVNESVPSATPDTAFRWDATAEQWIFNISTSGQVANRTYVYTVTLNDGTTRSFRYGLR